MKGFAEWTRFEMESSFSGASAQFDEIPSFFFCPVKRGIRHPDQILEMLDGRPPRCNADADGEIEPHTPLDEGDGSDGGPEPFRAIHRCRGIGVRQDGQELLSAETTDCVLSS